MAFCKICVKDRLCLNEFDECIFCEKERLGICREGTEVKEFLGDIKRGITVKSRSGDVKENIWMHYF